VLAEFVSSRNVTARTSSVVEAGEIPAIRRGNFIVIHPRYRTWLAKCGIASAADAWNLPGEVVCGHPDRHVVRCELGSGRRVVFLKREHVVGWRVRLKNTLAGFGPVSRAEREAECLQRLERLGLPGPQWLAYGETDGRAFLLVDGLTDHIELRDLLADNGLSPKDRLELTVRLGRAVADLHDAGFDTPDLSAKHVFVRPDTLLPTLIDWQSARPRISLRERVRALATLTASVADRLANPRQRLRVLWAYRRSVYWPDGRPQFGKFARMVQAEAAAIKNRSSVREQCIPTAGTPNQRLVWLAGEEVCVRPDIVAHWPTPVAGFPFYSHHPAGVASIHLPDYGSATLVRFRSLTRPDWVDRLIGRPWRSPGVTLARVFFHLERHGVPVLRLLAFGQKRTGYACGDSFILYQPNRESTADLATWRLGLFAAGVAVRAMHEAGCRLTYKARAAELLHIAADGKVTLNPSCGIRKVRTVAPAGRLRDLDVILRNFKPAVSRTDRLRLLAGYYAGDRSARTRIRSALRILGVRTTR
jgi:tRNA A-37 threonylcarbamoyl transferase component Bud32